jgi:hypothetical protein
MGRHRAKARASERTMSLMDKFLPQHQFAERHQLARISHIPERFCEAP